MRKSGASAAKANAGELEFPDWSGMDDTSRRVTAEAAFRLCEEYLAWLPECARAEILRREKCLVEFNF